MHEMPALRVEEHPASTLVAAASAATASSLYGGRELGARDRERLLQTRPARALQLAHEDRRIATAGMILARARWGSVAEALELANAVLDAGDDERDLPLAPETMSALWAAMSEAFSTAARPRQGMLCAERLLGYALDTGDDAWAYRALGLLAAAAAFAGEFVLAENTVARADAIAHRGGWDYSIAAYPLIAAELLIGSARVDAAGLAAIAQRSRDVPAQIPIWSSFTAIAEGMALMLAGQPARAASPLIAVLNGAHAAMLPRIAHDFVLGTLATVSVARGQPQRAITMLRDAPSDAEHTVCLNLQRASAYLQLGDNHAVLSATTDCVRLGEKHCLRTLPPILLRRAVANMRLGHQRAADESFADAFHLMIASAAATPLLTLDRSEVETLLTRLGESHPDLRPSIDLVRRRTLPMPVVTPPPLLPPKLSEREAEVAALLRQPLPLRELAERLFVSQNTMKTHTQALYRKLGVTSRVDAVSFLERSGFYD